MGWKTIMTAIENAKAIKMHLSQIARRRKRNVS